MLIDPPRYLPEDREAIEAEIAAGSPQWLRGLAWTEQLLGQGLDEDLVLERLEASCPPIRRDRHPDLDDDAFAVFEQRVRSTYAILVDIARERREGSPR